MKTKNYMLLLALFTATLITVKGATKWNFETGGKVIASPILHNEKILVGSLDGFFYALNSETGEEEWKFNTENQIRTIAAIYNDELICFESGNTLYGLDLDGKMLWSTIIHDGSVVNQHDQWDCFRSSPTLKDSIAYIGSEEGKVLGVNVKNGAIVFSVQTPQANATIETTPLVVDTMIYVGDWLGVFSAFNTQTQELVWQHDTKNDHTYDGWVNAIMSKPLFYNGNVYFGGRSCNLYCFSPKGEQQWMYHDPEDKWLFGGPIVDNNVLYVGSSYQQNLYAFNANSPEMLWKTNVGGLNYGDPAIVNDYVIVGTGGTSNSNSGSISIVDKNTHEKLAKFEVNGWVETPLYNNGIIYFGSGDKKVYAIEIDEVLNPTVGIQNSKFIKINNIYPNPTSGQAIINIETMKSGNLSIKIIDNKGAEVKTIASQVQPKGSLRLKIDSSEFISGVYFCQVTFDKETVTHKLVVE